MTAERGARRGLRYDITGIKRHCDDSSKHTHPDTSFVNGIVPIQSDYWVDPIFVVVTGGQ